MHLLDSNICIYILKNKGYPDLGVFEPLAMH
jgi:hypothetical protein